MEKSGAGSFGPIDFLPNWVANFLPSKDGPYLIPLEGSDDLEDLEEGSFVDFEAGSWMGRLPKHWTDLDVYASS